MSMSNVDGQGEDGGEGQGEMPGSSKQGAHNPTPPSYLGIAMSAMASGPVLPSFLYRRPQVCNSLWQLHPMFSL